MPHQSSIWKALQIQALSRLIENYLSAGYSVVDSARLIGICPNRAYELINLGMVRKDYAGAPHGAIAIPSPSPASASASSASQAQ